MNDQASGVRGQNGVGGFECIVRAYWSGGAGGRHGGRSAETGVLRADSQVCDVHGGLSMYLSAAWLRYEIKACTRTFARKDRECGYTA